MTTTPTPTGLGGRIAIRVLGTPIPQGSLVPFIDRATRRARVKASNEPTLKAWRKHVTATAKDTCRYHDTITGDVRVWVRFTFTRPPSHYRTGRNAHLLKDRAPRNPGRACGDIDKLQRAIFDALTDAGVWVDDTQVVDVRARKFYAGEDEYAMDRPGVDIIIEEIGR